MSLEHWIYKFPLRARSLFRRNQVEDELNAELQYHMEREAESLMTQGMSAQDARTAAFRTLNVERQKEKCREARGISLIQDLFADIRYALRSMRRTPSLAAVIVFSLALGIGANTAIFSVINAVTLKMLPVREPQELMLLNWSATKWPEPFVEDVEGSGGRDASGTMSSHSFSSYAYNELKKQNGVFDNAVAFAANDEDVNIELNGQADSAHLQAVSGDFFHGLGVSPRVGRVIIPSDDSDSAVPVAMISYDFWRKHFTAGNEALGKPLTVNGERITIVGVSPPEFFGVVPGTAIDIFIPLSLYVHQMGRLYPDAPLTSPKTWWLGVIGRNKPGVTPSQARSELQIIWDRTLRASVAPGQTSVIPVMGLTEAGRGLNNLREKFSSSLLLLLGMVGLVLLIACANVAGLLLARCTAREKEIGVRLSLGASRARIIRQLLTESMVLGLLGGIAGVLISFWASSALVDLLSAGRNPVFLSVHPDIRVLSFTATISILSGLLFGLLPAIVATRVNVGSMLKQHTRQLSVGRGGLRVGRVLVAGQVGLSLLLLVAAGLLLRTLDQLRRVDVGFDHEDLLTFHVRPGLNGYKEARLSAYYEELQRRLQSLAGVRSVSFSQHGPIDSGMISNSPVIPGYTAPGTQAEVYRHIVGPGYFETLSIPILLGRALNSQDTTNSPKSIVVNETLVRKYFHGDNPIGKELVYGRNGNMGTFAIVGIAKDVKYGNIRSEAPPTAYWPYLQSNLLPGQMTFLVRTKGAPSPLANSIYQVSLDLDKDVPVVKLQTEEEVINGSLFLERTLALLSTSFGTLALLLACVGLYGTVAYDVARRRAEIGVRMALGAQRGSILRMILFETAYVVIPGVLIGLPIALMTTRVLIHQLYELSPHDPITIGGSIAMILAITLLAGYLPARHASKVNPLVALRYE